MKHISIWLLLIVALPVWAQPKIVASIKPLQLIAQAVAGNQFTVDVLLPPGATPHHYSMRPSDIEKIAEADLVLWLGPSAEPYLQKLADRSVLHEKMLNITPVEIETEILADLHIWLGPKLALALATQISARLERLDPAAGDNYQANLGQFEQQIRDFSNGLVQRLSSKVSSYLVYHDAYRYFEKSAGISHAGIISINPEIKPGARWVAQLQRLAEQGQVSCIFAEPQADMKIIELIANQGAVRVIQVDPMASSIEPGSGAYLEFLADMAERFGRCQPSRQ